MKVKPFSPSIINYKPYSIDKGYLSDCCRFVTLILFMPPLNRVEKKFNMNVEFDFCEGGPSDGARPIIVVFMNHAL